MPYARPGDTVRIDYVGMLDTGEVFERTTGTRPLQFTIGTTEVIPGLGEAVVGMSPGEARTARIPAEKAFGPIRKEMAIVVKRDSVSEEDAPRPNEPVEITLHSGESILARVAHVSESTLTLDANHPLAGQDLTFAIRLVDIVEPNRVDPSQGEAVYE